MNEKTKTSNNASFLFQIKCYLHKYYDTSAHFGLFSTFFLIILKNLNTAHRIIKFVSIVQ